MKERNEVRLGQRVRDLDGNDLGRVKELYESGFSVVKGLPFLFRRDLVARYDEVREVRDGTLVLARSESDLLVLAAGGIPPAWRVEPRQDQPAAATPGEAHVTIADEEEPGSEPPEEPEAAPPRGRTPRADAAHP